jgi:L-alanine-DL-glutamate epimerase-like enolase superfamily enzyme
MLAQRTFPRSPEFSSTRRRFLRNATASAAALACAGWSAPLQPLTASAGVSSKWLTVVDIQRTTVQVPFREIPARAMAREIPHWQWLEVFEVTLKGGAVGLGESMLFYSWKATDDAAVERARGRNAAELMWDDSFGAGLQMALFDAVARTFDAPVHSLLGKKSHAATPLSWWNIDTSPEDMAAECREAYRLGYRAYKTKGRPWFDLWKQIELSAKEVPAEFKIDMDFNDTLLTAERGIPILKQFDNVPHVAIWETPIPQKDLVGNAAICEAVRPLIAMHYGSPEPRDVIRANACDGFIANGGATDVMNVQAVCAMLDKPFWLQLVGSGITAAFSLHFGGACSHATWPAVNCHQLFTHTLLTEPIPVIEGLAKVPDRPGLGYELDRDAVAKFRVKKPTERPNPPRLLETTWPDGRVMYVASGRTNFLLLHAIAGKMPYFERGVTTRLVPDDGSSGYKDLLVKAATEPYFPGKR